MEKIIRKGTHVGYRVGNNIIIQENEYKDTWRLTIEPLEIYNINLCSKRCTEAEIARYVHLVINDKLIIANGLIKDIIPFT